MVIEPQVLSQKESSKCKKECKNNSAFVNKSQRQINGIYAHTVKTKIWA